MQDPKIEDIASFKKLLEDAHSLEQFKRLFPLLKPFLKRLGVNVEQIDQALAEVEQLAVKARALTKLPDRFNGLFSARGWILYEMMNVEVAQSAVDKAESGDIDGAEQLLVDYYNEETINMQINWMKAVEAFRPRISLARLALTDYLEGRYYACVPVVLALLDGTVNQLNQRGFFTEGVKLEAWDSIAAHSKGLAELSKVLGSGRYKTTTEQLTIPYRNGILHGMDLGYGNKLVAAKAWAALFAIRTWAIKVERRETSEPPAQPKKSWEELIRKIKENGDKKVRLEIWSPREIHIGEDIPSSGNPEDYETGTPERRLAEFLFNWSRRNYGGMAECFMIRDKSHLGRAAGKIRSRYETKSLKSFELLEVQDGAPAVTTARIKVLYEENEIDMESILEIRLVNEDVQGQPAMRGEPGSSWGLAAGYL